MLWANYFALKVQEPVFWKYTVTANERPRKEGGQPKPPKGRKLYFVMQQVLRHFGRTLIATEFKSQLVTLEKLSLEENPFKVEVSFDESDPRMVDVFDVTISGPFEARVDELLDYLKNQPLLANDHVFPRFPESVDALNVILGHGPRSRHDQITPVGSARFFPYGPDLAAEAPLSQRSPRPLSALRGFFQSTRPATGQLLLNANVTCGVFRRSGRAHVLFEELGIRGVPQSGDHRLKNHILSVSKMLRKARVWVDIRLDDGKVVRKSKAIHDLVTPFNILRSGANPPRVDQGFFFAAPQNISFFIQDGNRAQYITVAQHYQQSRHP